MTVGLTLIRDVKYSELYSKLKGGLLAVKRRQKGDNSEDTGSGTTVKRLLPIMITD